MLPTLINYNWCLSCSACKVISKGKREIINIITMNSWTCANIYHTEFIFYFSIYLTILWQCPPLKTEAILKVRPACRLFAAESWFCPGQRQLSIMIFYFTKTEDVKAKGQPHLKYYFGHCPNYPSPCILLGKIDPLPPFSLVVWDGYILKRNTVDQD